VFGRRMVDGRFDRKLKYARLAEHQTGNRVGDGSIHARVTAARGVPAV
jgi:hypothetical protein